jgi:ribosomal protein L18
MPYGEGVRGINDLRVAVLDNTDTPGTSTDFVGIKEYSVSVTSDSDQELGDDQVLMVVRENKQLDVSLTSVYANLAALATVTGTTVVTSGTTPNRINTYQETGAANTAYAQLTGQALGRDANNSALRLTTLKAQLTDGPNWDFAEGSWSEPQLGLTGVAKGGYLYTLASYETLVALS